MKESEMSRVLLVLNRRTIHFFTKRGCRREDAEDLAGDFIRQILANDTSIGFLQKQSKWITENGIPKRYFPQLCRLLQRFFRRSQLVTTVPLDQLDRDSCDTILTDTRRGAAAVPFHRSHESARDVAREVLDLFADTLPGKQRRAFEMLRVGYTSTEAAREIGVDERTIRNWRAKWHSMAASFENN